MMTGESGLENLVQNMSPTLRLPEYVFCSIKNARYGDYAAAEPLAAFLEEEGLSLVLTRNAAKQLGLVYAGVFKCISLEIHSSLEAVGLTATVSSELARHGIAANVVAAHYHDHIFVPLKYADRAIELLSGLSNCSSE